MTPDQLLALGTAFAAYLRLFEVCIAYRPTAEHLHSYCRGLVSDLPRKSIEPMALACGTAVRTLQEFLRDHVWDQFRMRDLLQHRLARLAALHAAADLGTIGVIDETSVAKKGTKTPGVRRQYCGASGKIENGIVTVHLGIVRGLFKTLIDAALFLPKVWSEDRERCREAKIPDDVVYRPKWRIALEQVACAIGNGLTLDWLTFDEYYGGKPAFLEELDTRSGTAYIGEIPRNFRCLTRRPRGQKPKKGWKGKRADNLTRFSAAWNQQDWHGVSLSRLTLDNQDWDVRTGQVYLLRRGELSERTYWLLVACNPATGEVKYFLSNASADTPLEKLLRVAFTRWNVEHTFRVAKSEIGLGHFEGRSYVALMRHMILCLIAMGFVAEHTDRLRGKNPEITMEQVCRALNQRCRTWQMNRRQTTEVEHTVEVIDYHQRRNCAARISRQKQRTSLLI
jgi:SRSO17 transposase